MQPAISPREASLDLGGATLHFTTWGDQASARDCVLLIHGLTVSSREFAELGPVLAEQGWYVVAPDLRGRGSSDKPPHGYSVPIHANDLLGLCDQLGLGAFHVVGHSLGGLIGLYLAALSPQRVNRLVVIDIGGNIPADAQQAIAATVNRLGTVYPSLDAYLDTMRHLPVLRWNAMWEGLFRYDADVRPDGTVVSRVPQHAIAEEVAVLDLLRGEDLPARVRQPTLVLRAALGTLAPDRGLILTREEAERMRAVMPDCRLIEVPETNHYTIILADVLTQAVVRFLAEESPGASPGQVPDAP